MPTPKWRRAILYTDAELDEAVRKSLRDLINEAWKEIYFQLGRNKAKPLNDDDFLRAHWMMYFMHSRKTGCDYIKFLLDKQFTPQRVYSKTLQPVKLEESEEQRSDADVEAEDENGLGGVENSEPVMVAGLQPKEIRDYAISLKESSVHWFSTFYPTLVDDLTQEEIERIECLNRLGMAYFRPLLMAILKTLRSTGRIYSNRRKTTKFLSSISIRNLKRKSGSRPLKASKS